MREIVAAILLAELLMIIGGFLLVPPFKAFAISIGCACGFWITDNIELMRL